MNRLPRVGWSRAAMLAGLLAVASPAWSQGGLTALPISHRDVERLLKDAEASPGQIASVRALEDGFESAFERAAREFRASDTARRGAAPDERAAAEAHFDAALKAFVIEKRTLTSAFMSDLEGVLTSSQHAAWEAAERRVRRRGMRAVGWTGVTGWSMLDLTSLVEATPLSDDDRSEALPVLDSWEHAVDAELQARDARIDASLSWDAAREAASRDELLKADYDTGEALAEINRASARQLLNVLSEQGASRLQNALRPLVYPTLATPRTAPRLLDRAWGLTDLDASQQSRLTGLVGRYERESARADEEIVARADAGDEAGKRYFRLPEKSRSGAGEDPRMQFSRAAQSRRDGLESRTISELREILSEAQWGAVREDGVGAAAR